MSEFGLKNIGVIGAGQMGSGIAQVFATHGFSVILLDQKESQIDLSKKVIQKSLTKLNDKGKLSCEEKETAENNLNYTTSWQDLAECNLAIEAIIESEQAKGEVFKKLEGIVNNHCIFASNTSSISITKLSSYSERPDRFIGMHFMNPVPIMKLVEIIPGMATNPQVTETISRLAETLGKEVSRSQDYPGFVVNRILMPMINEAFTTLMEGVANAEDIDKGMKLGTNQPMGPLALADFIGLDTCLAIMRVLHNGLGDSKYRPSPLLVKYVEAGFLGKKVGRGVYSY